MFLALILKNLELADLNILAAVWSPIAHLLGVKFTHLHGYHFPTWCCGNLWFVLEKLTFIPLFHLAQKQELFVPHNKFKNRNY